MKKIAIVLMLFVVVLLIAPAAFAQGTTPEKAPINPSFLAIAAGFGMGIAAHNAGWIVFGDFGL